jgi:hypothetical protein
MSEKPANPPAHQSALPCGCDAGAQHVCEWHQREYNEQFSEAMEAYSKRFSEASERE